MPIRPASALFIEQYALTPEATYRAAVQCLVTFDERANLAAIKVPVLCLAAEHDRNAPPPVLEKMAAKIPGARYVCLPGLGHMPNLEAPQAFDAAIFNFLNAALAGEGLIASPHERHRHARPTRRSLRPTPFAWATRKPR